MNIHIDSQGWGAAKMQDIAAVLSSVVQVFSPCFSNTLNQNDLLILHTADYPVTFTTHNVIGLSAHDRYWNKYVYQFAHEYCHYQIGGNVSPVLRWFEESICELASYFFMPRVAQLWETTPPYPNWRDYAYTFTKYALEDEKKATPFNIDFSMNSSSLNYLTENEYDRSKNAYVATLMKPIFEANPLLWSSIHFIGDIPHDLSFQDALLYWHDVVPEKFKDDIQAIACIFSICF